MERMTFKSQTQGYAASLETIHVEGDAVAGPAIDRLGAFEDAAELVEQQLARTTAKLDELKAKGRIRSAQGQQLLAQKIAYSSVLSLMGLRDGADG